jgi:septum formation protein
LAARRRRNNDAPQDAKEKMMSLPNAGFVLASKSPRRQELLKLLGIPFTILTADTNEDFDAALAPSDIVRSLAERKGKAIRSLYPNETQNKIILSADTTVVLGNKILNKPDGEAEAFEMLSMLQGKTHHVYTGFALTYNAYSESHVETTDVTFSQMNETEIRNYIRVAKPFDKAGSYGIQDDLGACFIERINGCYYNVVGLPLSKLYRALQNFSHAVSL